MKRSQNALDAVDVSDKDRVLQAAAAASTTQRLPPARWRRCDGSEGGTIAALPAGARLQLKPRLPDSPRVYVYCIAYQRVAKNQRSKAEHAPWHPRVRLIVSSIWPPPHRLKQNAIIPLSAVETQWEMPQW